MSKPPAFTVTVATVFAVLFAFQGILLAMPIRFLAWNDEIAARKIGFQSGKGVSELEDLHPYARSKPFDGSVGETPLLLVASDRKSADGKPVTVEIKIASGVTSPLVIILPDPKHPSGLRTFAIEDSPGNFAWGSVRFINATGKHLLFRCDKTITDLPGSWNPVDIAPGGAARNMIVQAVAKDDLKDILYSGVWEHSPEIRNLVIVVPGADVRTGVVDFKTIPEDRRILALDAASKE